MKRKCNIYIPPRKRKTRCSLHSTAQAQNQVQSRLFLDVVIRQSTAVLQLLASKNQTLLIGGNAFLVLNFGLHVFNGVGSLHIKGDGLASQSFNENLHFFFNGVVSSCE